MAIPGSYERPRSSARRFEVEDLARIEAGKLELEILDFDLATVVKETTQLLAVKAQEKSLELVSIIDPGAPSSLRGDGGRLRQVLLNLVGNALKFTLEGSVIVRARLEWED